MAILLPIAAVITGASLLLCALVGVVLWIRARRRRNVTPGAAAWSPWRFGTWTLLAHVPLALVYTVVGAPAVLAWFAVYGAGTRGDEIHYRGPRLDANGAWLATSASEGRAQRATGTAARAAGRDDDVPARAHYVTFTAEDGVTLGAWHVPARTPAVGLAAVCVHGWIRGGLEIDPVGAMFHELGCEVLLLETRGHGRSGGHCTFGRGEALDVRAAVRWLRARPGHGDEHVVLFGVSLGTVGVSLAAPTIDGLAGIVLDAPPESLGAVAARLMEARPGSTRRRMRAALGMPQPIPRIVRRCVEVFAGTDLDAMRPINAVQKLPPDLPALVIGGADDERMPPDVVRAVFDAIPAPPTRKELWIRDGSGHGRVWLDDADGYRARLKTLVERARTRAGLP